MPNVTISFDRGIDGWTSEFDFRPDNALSLNNNYYSCKHGNIYRHNSPRANRNEFYSDTDNDTTVTTPTTIEFVFNDNPSSVKNFKTLSYEGSTDWDATMRSYFNGQFETGSVEEDAFLQREGKYHGVVRGDDTGFASPDFASGNVNGIGTATITNPFDVDALNAFLTGLSSVGAALVVTDQTTNQIRTISQGSVDTPFFSSFDADNLDAPASTWASVTYIGELNVPTGERGFTEGLSGGDPIMLYTDAENYALYSVEADQVFVTDGNAFATVNLIEGFGSPGGIVTAYKGGNILIPAVLDTATSTGRSVVLGDREGVQILPDGRRSVSTGRAAQVGVRDLYYFTAPGDFATHSRDWTVFNRLNITTTRNPVEDNWNSLVTQNNILLYVDDTNWALYTLTSNVSQSSGGGSNFDYDVFNIEHVSSKGQAPALDTGMTIYYSTTPDIATAVVQTNPVEVPSANAERLILTSIPSSLAVQDLLFAIDPEGTSLEPRLIGRVSEIGDNYITRTRSLGEGGGAITISTPVAGDFIFYAKNAEIEKSGIIGFYNIVTMENNSESMAELFSVETNTFISSQ